MPTSSEESDLRWDRVEAREAHYRQSSQGNPQPPNAKKRIDSIELGLMGTHFEVVSEDESFPARIDDFTDNEAAGPSCGAELKVRRDSIYDQPDSDSSVAKKPIAETGFTPKWGPYLPLSEMIETRRQLLSSKKRPPSLSTTIDPGVHEEQSPTPEHEIHIPLVTNPTPSNRSMCTTRKGSCKGEKEFLPPYSWSYYDIKLGRLNGKEAK